MSASVYDIARGLTLNLSQKLTDKEKNALVKFIGRISEASYRRGYQQGHYALKSGNQVTDPSVLRFDRSLDNAPWGENAKSSGRNSVDILKIEYGHCFEDIGLALDLPPFEDSMMK